MSNTKPNILKLDAEFPLVQKSFIFVLSENI